MNIHTQSALMTYVIALMEREGFTSIHVSELIPASLAIRTDLGNTVKKWTQFPELGEYVLVILSAHNITYDRHSGWFRKV